MDDKNLGYLPHEQLLINLTTRGDKLPIEIVESLLTNEEYNHDKKFYYKKFSQVGGVTIDTIFLIEEDWHEDWFVVIFRILVR